MSDGERQKRRRDRARALRDAEPPTDGVAVEAQVSDPPAIAAQAAALATTTHDYPRMLYHPDGRTTIVDTLEHHHRLEPEGWGTTPLAVHQQRPVSHHGFLSTDNPFARPLPHW
jgi:hypothetical protein